MEGWGRLRGSSTWLSQLEVNGRSEWLINFDPSCCLQPLLGGDPSEQPLGTFLNSPHLQDTLDVLNKYVPSPVGMPLIPALHWGPWAWDWLFGCRQSLAWHFSLNRSEEQDCQLLRVMPGRSSAGEDRFPWVWNMVLVLLQMEISSPLWRELLHGTHIWTMKKSHFPSLDSLCKGNNS